MATNVKLEELKDKFKTGATPTEADYKALIERADVGRKAVGASDADITTKSPGLGLELDENGVLAVKRVKDTSGLTVSSDGVAVVKGAGIEVGPGGVAVRVSGALTTVDGTLHVVPGPGLSTMPSNTLALALANNSGLSISTSSSTGVLTLQIDDKTSGLTTSLSTGLLSVKLDSNGYLVSTSSGIGLAPGHQASLSTSLSTTLSSACNAVLSCSTTNGILDSAELNKTPLASALQTTFSTALSTASLSYSTSLTSLKGWSNSIGTVLSTTYSKGKTDGYMKPVSFQDYVKTGLGGASGGSLSISQVNDGSYSVPPTSDQYIQIAKDVGDAAISTTLSSSFAVLGSHYKADTSGWSAQIRNFVAAEINGISNDPDWRNKTTENTAPYLRQMIAQAMDKAYKQGKADGYTPAPVIAAMTKKAIQYISSHDRDLQNLDYSEYENRLKLGSSDYWNVIASTIIMNGGAAVHEVCEICEKWDLLFGGIRFNTKTQFSSYMSRWFLIVKNWTADHKFKQAKVAIVDKEGKVKYFNSPEDISWNSNGLNIISPGMTWSEYNGASSIYIYVDSYNGIFYKVAEIEK